MACRKFKLALVQMLVGPDKATNIKNAVSRIDEAAKAGAKIVVLPECFVCPYGNQYFSKYCEPFNGEITQSLAEVARRNSVDIIAGSMPEQEDGRQIFNTCPIVSRKGRLVGKYRKIHLFDINVPGKMVFKESETLSAGNRLTVFSTEFCKIGLGICYDVRFNELARLYAKAGCELLVYPGAFNMTTGPAHWELLARSRALDNQCFVALCSPARDTSASYVAWGHSLVVDPWGSVIAAADEKETIIYADIDLDRLSEVRSMIPISSQRRTDVYETISQSPIVPSE